MTQHDEERDKEYESNRRQVDAQLAGFARLARLKDHRDATAYKRALDDRIDQREEMEREGILSIEMERTITVVLCTGGPHVEVRWPEGYNPHVVGYGWFGAGKIDRPLTTDEADGFYAIMGEDWEEAAAMAGLISWGEHR